jgi:hypothetical protein
VDIAGATNQSYDVTQTGYYTIYITDENGCSTSATVYIVITGTEEILSDANISIYPNPSSGNLTVEILNNGMSGEISIDVVNAIGQRVFSFPRKTFPTPAKIQIDLRNDANTSIAPGIYFIEIKTEHDFLRKKIVIGK